MATFVDRIKDKVRSRSSSRSSTSAPMTQGVGRNSTDLSRIPDRNAAQASLPSSPTTRNDIFPRTSLENSAFHVTRGSGRRASLDSPVTRKPLPSSAIQHKKKYSVGGQQPGLGEIIPARESSRQSTVGDYTRPQTSGQAADNLAPVRTSSRRADTTPRALQPSTNSYLDSPVRGHTRRISIPERLPQRQPADPELSKPLPEVPAVPEIPAAYKSHMAPLREPGHSATPTNDPMSSSAWMSPLISTGSKPDVAPTTSQDNDAAKYEAIARGHLRLPEKFNLQNTEDTHVYETQRPAVTHETIIKERVEIIQEEITRDIHVHHYYTYQQPIKVVEILPPKHYFLDLETGVKTEIDPPFGWTMPVSMNPVVPDTKHLAAWTRHYLVNDEHPYGIPEAPPAVPQEVSRVPTTGDLRHEHVSS